VGRRQAIASSFEVGIHNGTLAIAVALGVLGNERLAVPAAVYGVIVFPVAMVAGFLFVRASAAAGEADPEPEPAPRSASDA